jgi:hypothetical protein
VASSHDPIRRQKYSFSLQRWFANFSHAAEKAQLRFIGCVVHILAVGINRNQYQMIRVVLAVVYITRDIFYWCFWGMTICYSTTPGTHSACWRARTDEARETRRLRSAGSKALFPQSNRRPKKYLLLTFDAGDCISSFAISLTPNQHKWIAMLVFL